MKRNAFEKQKKGSPQHLYESKLCAGAFDCQQNQSPLVRAGGPLMGHPKRSDGTPKRVGTICQLLSSGCAEPVCFAELILGTKAFPILPQLAPKPLGPFLFW